MCSSDLYFVQSRSFCKEYRDAGFVLDVVSIRLYLWGVCRVRAGDKTSGFGAFTGERVEDQLLNLRR